MRILLSALIMLSFGCATKAPNDYTTEAESIFVNDPDDVKDCKFVGLVEVDGHKDWLMDHRSEELLEVVMQFLFGLIQLCLRCVLLVHL